MKKITLPHKLLYVAGLLLLAPTANATKNFQKYWYEQGAEISTYSLTKKRYGSTHKGTVVLVFVTENFLPVKQVKEDFSSPGKKERGVPILKLNGIHRFETGVYDYSVMQSVFSPIGLGAVDSSRKTYKVTTTFQDWCGTSFMQHNLSQGAYKSKHFSYFESEGDREVSAETNALLEEEVWVRIRLAPKNLASKTGHYIPSSIFLGLEHKPIKPYLATGKLKKKTFLGKACLKYTLSYEQLDRTLVVYFENKFPHAILGWEEFAVGGGAPLAPSKKVVFAQRKKVHMVDYWNRNQSTRENLRFRKKLLGVRRGF